MPCTCVNELNAPLKQESVHIMNLAVPDKASNDIQPVGSATKQLASLSADCCQAPLTRWQSGLTGRGREQALLALYLAAQQLASEPNMVGMPWIGPTAQIPLRPRFLTLALDAEKLPLPQVRRTFQPFVNLSSAETS
ncbi:hypothetical protein XI06_12820 [Bradyrhizobium sp. CCBAU 11434]|nr:hypothetical protein [Bradyrhizobium sp. CCBAU 11434]